MPLLKILQVPSVPMALILNQLDDVDVFQLSCCSEKSLRHIKSARANLKMDHLKLKFKSETEQSVEISSSTTSLEIQLLPEKKLTLMTTKSKKPVERFELKFHGVEHLATNILRIWKVTDYSLMWYLDRPIDNYIWRFTKNLRILYMSATNLPPVKLTPEELTYILDDVKLKTAFMNLKVLPEKNFQYTKPLQVHDLSLISPSWLHFDSILNSENWWNLVLCGYRPKTSDLRKLLKKWVAGGFPKLYFFSGVFDLGPGDRNQQHPSMTSDEFDEILEGIDREGRPPSVIQYMGQMVDVPNRFAIRQQGTDQEGVVFWGERIFGLYVHAARIPFDESM